MITKIKTYSSINSIFKSVKVYLANSKLKIKYVSRTFIDDIFNFILFYVSL